MEPAELDLDDDVRDLTADVLELSTDSRAAHDRDVPPSRLPVGTIAPPFRANDLDALRTQAGLQRSAQAWLELARTIRRIIDVGQLQDALGEQETIDLYAQLGELESDMLGGVAEAVDAWSKVLAIDPSDLRALTALETLFAREDRWEESIDVLERRALVLDDEQQRCETLLGAAALWEERAVDLTRAADLYERVRRADASQQLAAIACERLEALYRRQASWAELIDILLERSESVADVEQQIQILHDVASLYERALGDEESAFYVLQAASNRDHANEQTAQDLERLATATGHWPELLEQYSKRAGELEHEDRGAAADLWVSIARWYREHLAHLDHAIQATQQALRVDPLHAGALAAMADLHRKRGSWNGLSETLQRQAEVEPSPERRAELYLQLAESIERGSQDVSGAIHAYQQALANEPASRAALDALDRLYRATAAWEPLVEILSRRAELSSDESEIVRWLLEIGAIWDQRLSDTGQAIAAYQQVLELEPSDLVALRALEGLYDRTGQSSKYLEVLEAQLDASPSEAERISLYERIAAAWEEQFGDLDRAAQAYEKIVALDPRNTAAYLLLERLYQQAHRHEALVETYRHHVAATTDVAARIELYLAMAKVYEAQLHDVDLAIGAYDDALSLDGDDVRALDALGRLFEQTGDGERALDVMTRLVHRCDDARVPDLWSTIGRIQYSQLGDPAAAEVSLSRALAFDPGHMAAMLALTDQYADRGDWLKAAQMMTRAQGHTQVAVDKVRLLVAAADVYLHKLRADEQAKQLYAAVIAIDPEHVAAGRWLAELYFAAGQWSELAPVIDMLCRKVGQLDADPKELNELHYRAARCADELGDVRKALGHYQTAYTIDPTYLPTLLGRADLLFKKEDWDNAGKLYQAILIDHRDSQDRAGVVRLYSRLGKVRQALGERKKALGMFDKALELDPHHRDTLQAVIDLHAQLGDWEAVVRAKRGLIETADGREKTKLLDEVAALHRDRLQNAVKATTAYLEALDITPEDHQLLQKVLDLYIETKQWKKAVEIMERFIALETDSCRRGVYCHAAGTVCRDELKSLDEAVDYYSRALDSFFSQPERLDDEMLPRALKSFEAIDKLLTSKRDWTAQERACREMIMRLPKGGDPRFYKLQVGLLDGLAEIYRSRLKQYGDAIDLFELAQQLDPGNELRHDGTDRAEILAELYGFAGADHADKAVAQHTRMLRREPFKYDSYQTLASIYKETQQYDKLWCMCSALAFLRKADPDQQRFYEQYKPRGLVKAKRAMPPDCWTKLAHPDENRYISAIFGACWQSVAALNAFPHKDFGLRRGERHQLHGDQLMFSKLFLYVAQVLNVPLPEVYLRDDNKSADIQLANAIDRTELCPSFVVRPHLLQGKTEREVAFLAARRLAFMRPEYYLRMLLPTNTELKVVVLAAIAMLQPRFPLPPNMVATVEQYQRRMQKHLPPHALEQLGVIVQRFLQATPEIDLAKWGFAVDAMSHRAGFVVCGDLEVAARAVAGETVVVDGPTTKDKIKELLLFSVSEEYFAIRSRMELTIAG